MPSTDETGKSISFERWINGMSNDEYADMLDESNPFGFSDAQEEKALNIRQAPTKEEEEDLELEQEGEIEEEKPRREKPISIKEGITEIEQPVGEPIKITKVGERVTMVREPIPSGVGEPTIPKIVTPPRTVIPPSKPAVASFRSAVTTAIKSAGQFVRRFFRV